jgi:hypothetical protein
MLIISTYNSSTKTEKCWFESSNIFYSEFVEDSEKNEGDLYVTFNNGATYKYKNVQLTPDYVMFKHGGLEGSHGKALNAHIKPKYTFEKMDNKNVEDLVRDRLLIQKSQNKKDVSKIYFISGHRDITLEEFQIYKEALNKIVQDIPDSFFVVGDYHGVDIMAQNYLLDELEINPDRLTVYHMFDEPRNYNPKIMHTVGGFTTDEERDAAMTKNSGHDIAFIKSHNILSGTAQNILRRHTFSYNIE